MGLYMVLGSLLRNYEILVNIIFFSWHIGREGATTKSLNFNISLIEAPRKPINEWTLKYPKHFHKLIYLNFYNQCTVKIN